MVRWRSVGSDIPWRIQTVFSYSFLAWTFEHSMGILPRIQTKVYRGDGALISRGVLDVTALHRFRLIIFVSPTTA